MRKRKAVPMLVGSQRDTVPPRVKLPVDPKDIDVTGDVGPIDSPGAKIPMYSFNRPAFSFWNGVAKAAARRGRSMDEIEELLRSREMRHMLDRFDHEVEALGEALLAKWAKREWRR